MTQQEATVEQAMTQDDDRVIPIEEAVRRRRAREQQEEDEERARQEREGAGEVHISDAMSRLIEEVEKDPEDSTAEHLRRILEREFSEDEDEAPGGDAGRPDRPTGTGED
jgi:hypothetical protein